MSLLPTRQKAGVSQELEKKLLEELMEVVGNLEDDASAKNWLGVFADVSS